MKLSELVELCQQIDENIEKSREVFEEDISYKFFEYTPILRAIEVFQYMTPQELNTAEANIEKYFHSNSWESL